MPYAAIVELGWFFNAWSRCKEVDALVRRTRRGRFARSAFDRASVDRYNYHFPSLYGVIWPEPIGFLEHSGLTIVSQYHSCKSVLRSHMVNIY